jgi:alcohol dehydrogenase YqhD (iron-dependent ADH family)
LGAALHTLLEQWAWQHLPYGRHEPLSGIPEKTEKHFATYGRNVWGLTGTDDAPVAREAIARTRQFFTETMHMPATLHEVGITDEEHFDVMAQKAADGSKGSFVPLTKEDIVEIYRAAK